jgi:hypothetical protein
MDATHTVNHHDPLPPQIAALDLSVPPKYITHSTEQYLAPCAEIAAPLRQSLQGTKPYYGVDVERHQSCS